MLNQILSHLQNPGELEKLYRSNKSEFKQAFLSVYPEIKGKELTEFWHERLKDEPDAISWGSKKEHGYVILAILIAGFLAKIPEIFSVDEEFFYPRNISFIVLPLITAFFAWKNQLSLNAKAVLVGITGLSLVYINSLPGGETDMLVLACIHLPLILWGLLGAAYSGRDLLNWKNRLSYLRFNGEAAVMSVLIGIGGGLLSAITINLFLLIDVQIGDFWARYVVPFGLPAVPILGVYLTHTNPQLVNKVSPVIAKIFSPLVLVMLVVYLVAIAVTGKDPYNDREFLMLFNVVLIGVIALIFFSVAESSGKKTDYSGVWILLLLSIVTVVVNGVALSAIVFRISEWGITPNRMAVLGGNILILIHLLKITWKLYQTATKKAALEEVGKTIVVYLPIYMLWTAVVVFLFPVMFGFE
ncbi:DUF4153 domain-containing protein [Algoriphagus sp. A40]|uniref:DUF4153 domain-containing protein n=1 Tax=Algoriphagus sp. A40 TaxID=1945863 RepID=UPI000985A226|nr:DUF4153 domain-containing protein [Algoriphagus sp. A40]OOG77885.1 hypothetical protein B0E43_03745 [Algoriphagus sp. A40]